MRINIGFTYIIIVVLILLFVVVEVRLYKLQVVYGSTYREQLFTDNTTTFLDFVLPLRGRIFDVKGRILVDNDFTYDLYIPTYNVLYPVSFKKVLLDVFKEYPASSLNGIPNISWNERDKIYRLLDEANIREKVLSKIKDVRLKYIQELANAYNIGLDDLLKKISAFHADDLPQVSQNSFIVVERLPYSILERFEANQTTYPFVKIQTRFRRNYIYGASSSHILGYVGYLSKVEREKIIEQYVSKLSSSVADEVAMDIKNSVSINKLVTGRLGVEAYYDKLLTGTLGVVGKHGKYEFTLVSGSPGKDLYLTIDIEFQRAMENIFRNYCIEHGVKGAAILMDGSDGDILALLSFPNYDPNGLVPNAEKPNFSYLNDEGKPLLNRAISGLYSPASIFKLVSTSAAFRSGKVNLDTKFICRGYYPSTNRVFRCWYHSGHGALNIVDALKHSCNAYFYNLINLITAFDLLNEAKLWRLHEKSNIDIAYETSGILPNEVVYSNDDFLNMVIGQGKLAFTLSELISLVNTIATNGYFVRLRINKEREILKTKINISEATLSVLRRGMWKVIHEPGGTAYGLGLEKFNLYGKTGTSQVVSSKRTLESTPDLSQLNSLFCGFFYTGSDRAKKNPKTLCIIFEKHGSGKHAARFAKDVIELYNRFYRD